MRSSRTESLAGPRAWFGIPSVALGAVLVFTASLAAQQTGQVLGVIVNGETQEPLIQAQVTIQGTNLGTITNQDGRFILRNVPAGERTVVAQLIGYGERRQTVAVPAGGSATVELELFPSAVELEGLVVTGAAMASQKREIGNSVSTITAEEIESVQAMNFEDLLRGRAAGVSVTGTPGSAGAGSSIILRGTNSVNMRNLPLVYIDGVRMPTGVLETSTGEAEEHATFLGSIRPEDIDRIEVIKGGAARALYGEEAAGGVIQIFTKKDEGATARFEFRERPAGVIREVRVTGVEDEGDDERGISGRVLDVARKGLVRALGLIVKPLPFLAEASGSPLIVVDEEEWSQSRLETLDRELIDRVEVIKGDAARERWGERGANGVVRIFLKN